MWPAHAFRTLEFVVLPDLGDLPVGIAGSLAAGLIGYAIRVGWERLSRYLTRERLILRFWNFLGQPTHIFLPITNEDRLGAAGGYGDLLAMSDVVVLANSQFSPADSLVVHTNQGDFDSVRSQNVVVVGGGKYSEVYREVIEHLQPPIHFHDTDQESFDDVRDHDRTRVYSPAVASDGSLTYDIGLVLYARNPFAPSKRIVIAAGSHTYGSAAAMRFLMSRSGLRQLRSYFGAERIVFVVGCSVRGHSIGDPELISPIMEW